MSFGNTIKNIPRKGIVNQMPTPDQQGISDSKWIWKTFANIPITKSYAQNLVSGPPMGTVKKYPAGWCLSKGLKKPQKRYLTVDTIPKGKLNIPGISSSAFGNIRNMRGLIPGAMNDIYDINPQILWDNMQGKGKIIKECFNDCSNNSFDKVNSFNILIILIFISFTIYLATKNI